MALLNPALLVSKPLRLIFTRLPASDEEIALEYQQTVARMYNLAIIAIYVVISSIVTSPEHNIERWAWVILVYYVFYTPVAIFHMRVVKKHPGHYPARRIFIMSLDLASLGFSIAVHWSTMLPLYATIVWVTLGNGARYGSHYLILASIIAQLTLLGIYVFTPFLWQYNIVAITLSLTTLVIPLYALSLVKDVRIAKLAAEEASLAKSRFLAQASHDLRQPIHAIGLFLNGLKESRLNEDQEAIVERIDRSLEGVADLFKSLLDVSTLDSGAIEPKPRPLAISQLFADLEQQNQSAADWAGSSMRFMPSQALVRTDRALLTTIIQNLISNAIKYAPGRPILVGCRLKEETLSIWVCDRGDGIAEEYLPFLFDEFFQVREIGNRDTRGVGLGLSIVRRLASLLGLNVSIASRLGRGTTVAINGLQRWDAPDIEIEPRPQMRLAQPMQGIRIALIEDDIDVLDATAELLRQWGCEVQAFPVIPADPVACDMIITDFDVGGGLTGADYINSMRDAAGKAIPAIVMTGHNEKRVGEILNDPAIPILKKPIRPAELRSAIGSLRVQSRFGSSAKTAVPPP